MHSSQIFISSVRNSHTLPLYMYYVAASGHPLFPGTVLEFHANGLSFSYTPHIMSYIMITNEIAFAHFAELQY